MRLDFTGERVLAVMAHPDDAELLCAGTLARARAGGAEAIGVCVMCDGGKGVSSAAAAAASSPASSASSTSSSSTTLAGTRRSEASESAKLLGAELLWFGAPDGELFDDVSHRQRLVEIYRAFRPTLVITHSDADYHPDHRAASALAEAASWFAASQGHVTPSSALPAPPAVWFADTVEMSGFLPTFYVDVTAHVELKRRLLACHRSQLARGADGEFAPLEELMLRQCRARGAQSGAGAAEAFRQHLAFKRCRAW
jgi:N-acetylglucosamine malate deacetylase 1